MIISAFPSLYIPEGRSFEIDWPTLSRRLTSAKEHTGPLPRWAPALFRWDRRCLENVLEVHAEGLDVDSGASLAQLSEALEGRCAVVHTTKSSTPEVPRWRVVVALSRWVTPAEHPRVLRATCELVESKGIVVDAAPKDASRVWAVPIKPAAGPFIAKEFKGAVLNVEEALERFPAQVRPSVLPPSVPHAGDYAHLLHRARRWLEQVDGAVSGQGGHRHTFKIAVSLVRGFGLEAEDALRLLVEVFNDRCSPPWSLKELRHKVIQATSRSTIAPGWLADAPRPA